MDVLDTLKGGLEKVEEGWTTKVLSRDKDGRPVPPSNPRAVEWCVGGAFIAANDGHWGSQAHQAAEAFAAALPSDYKPDLRRYPWERMVAFNNEQEDSGPVIEIIKKAIKAKEAEPVPA